MYVATFVIHRKTANRHFLKSMARVGAGCDEFFDPKAKSKWQRKVIKFIAMCIPFVKLFTIYMVYLAVILIRRFAKSCKECQICSIYQTISTVLALFFKGHPK